MSHGEVLLCGIKISNLVLDTILFAHITYLCSGTLYYLVLKYVCSLHLLTTLIFFQLGSYLGFSITSCVLAGFVGYFYTPPIIDYLHNRTGVRSGNHLSIAVCFVIAFLAAVGLLVGVCSIVCSFQGCYFCGGSPRALVR